MDESYAVKYGTCYGFSVSFFKFKGTVSWDFYFHFFMNQFPSFLILSILLANKFENTELTVNIDIGDPLCAGCYKIFFTH